MSDKTPSRGMDGIPMISIDAPPPLADIMEARAAPMKGNVPAGTPKITVIVTIKNNNNNVVNATAMALIIM